jgi:RHS repeat-associated protein
LGRPRRGAPGYDAENRPYSAGGVTYYYDGVGERIAKSSGKLYFFGTGSAPVVETDSSGNITAEFVFFNGKRTARRDANGTIHYYFADHLGSANVIANATGTTIESESDFYPYGGERVVVADTIGNQYKFTGKERDLETGDDYFGARFYSSVFGRFLTPDWAATPVPIPYAVMGNPQTLNLYSYVENNPITGTDPDGHYAPPGSNACNGMPVCDDVKKDDSKKDEPKSAEEQQLEGTVNPLKGNAVGRVVSALVGGDEIAIASRDVIASETTQGKVGAGTALVLIVALNVGTAGEGKAVEKGTELAGREVVTVYRIVAADGKTIYVGITKDLARRAGEHGAELEKILGGLSRKDAKAVEQVLIEHFGRVKDGTGTLLNKINSIASKNPLYKEAQQYGKQALHEIGFDLAK